jgi:hypothetical protein
VAGTGAFLLVLAAAVFVAVRWDQIPDPAKLGTVTLLTGLCLVSGRALRDRLPATAGVLFHLGAFLLPIDVAALAVDQGVDWRGVLLLEGLTGLVCFSLLARLEPTVPLRWSIGLSGFVFSIGVAAVGADHLGRTGPTPGVVLAALALGAVIAGRRRLATVWAAGAGLTPPATVLALAVLSGTDDPVGRLGAVGLAGTDLVLVPVLTGLVAALVLGVEAHRRRDVALVVLAGISLVSGTLASWAELAPTATTSVVALSALVAAIELTALLLRHDRFWAPVGRGTAVVAESLASPTVVAAVALILLLPLDLELDPSPSLAGAAALLGFAWLLADLRRRPDGHASPSALVLGAGWLPATVAAPVSLVAAAGLAGGPVAAALAMTALAGLVLLSGRAGGPAVALALATWAPITAAGRSPWVAVGCGTVGAGLCAMAARRHAGRAVDRPTEGDVAWLYALGALVPAAGAGWSLALATDPAVGVTYAAALLWAVGVVCEPSIRGRWTNDIGLPARLASLTTLLCAPEIGAADTALLAGGLCVAAVVDAIRSDDPRLAYGLVVTGPTLVVSAAIGIGFGPAASGVALCVAATVAGGLALLVADRWARPLLATGIVALVAGVALSSIEPTTAGVAWIIAGGSVIAGGVVLRSVPVGALGGILVTLGTWIELDHVGIEATDAYAAPVAALLVGVGWSVRRHRSTPVSSWAAFGPAIVLLGGAALLERIDGGSGWHGLVAGAVGVAAVAAGGARRLSGPLVLGTALVVAVAGYESLTLTRGIPTWAWLAAGGTVLLAAGIAMERHEIGPVETGRRLVDVIHDRYT